MNHSPIVTLTYEKVASNGRQSIYSGTLALVRVLIADVVSPCAYRSKYGPCIIGASFTDDEAKKIIAISDPMGEAYGGNFKNLGTLIRDEYIEFLGIPARASVLQQVHDSGKLDEVLDTLFGRGTYP